jgi:hypothetical protein
VLGRPWDEVAADAARRGVPRAILICRDAAQVREGGAAERTVPHAELAAAVEHPAAPRRRMGTP